MKILEYFALGLPVVATSKAVEGIPLTAGHHAVIADELESFIEGIAEVLEGRSRIDLPSAREFAKKHDWSQTIPLYLELAGLKSR